MKVDASDLQGCFGKMEMEHCMAFLLSTHEQNDLRFDTERMNQYARIGLYYLLAYGWIAVGSATSVNGFRLHEKAILRLRLKAANRVLDHPILRAEETFPDDPAPQARDV